MVRIPFIVFVVVSCVLLFSVYQVGSDYPICVDGSTMTITLSAGDWVTVRDIDYFANVTVIRKMDDGVSYHYKEKIGEEILEIIIDRRGLKRKGLKL